MQFGWSIPVASRLLRLLTALALLGWFGTPLHSQDPGVEITDQADRAVAQFKINWSRNQTALDALRAREDDESIALERLLVLAGLPKMQACPDQEMTENERASAINLRGIKAAFKSAMTSEIDEIESLSREYSESVSSGRSYETQISLFDKLVWSRARGEMMRFLSPVFIWHEVVRKRTIENTCVARKILSSNWASHNNVDLLRTETSRRMAQEASFTSDDKAFSDTLSLIMKMP